MKNEEIEKIFTANGKRLILDMEIEENELIDMTHSLAKAWYLNDMDIPAAVKKKLIKSELKQIQIYCRRIVGKVNDNLEILNEAEK